MKKFSRHIITLFLLSASFFSAKGQNVNVTSAVDSSRIYIGDQIKYTITVDQPADLRLILPVYRDTLIKNIQILSGPVRDTTASQNGHIKIIEKYLITSFDSGRYQIPPAYVEVKNENGLKRFYSEYVPLEVMRVRIAPADTTAKIFDIVRPYNAPVTLGDLLPWILIIIVTGAVIWLAVRYVRNMRRSANGVSPVVEPDPAHVIAFRELEKLREEKLWQKGDIKSYYTRLTEILRQYLENRFGVYSLEMTTRETLDKLIKTGFKKNGNYNQLKGVLTSADLVKFAKYNPEPSEHESLFQNSWDFVMATKEEPEPVLQAADQDEKKEEKV